MDAHPAIVAPVMREVAVADLARSVAFYRDVLGFDVRGSEVVRGPARLQLVARAASSARPSVLFFQTDDVAALRAAIAARGAAPSELESVNGIKMRMCQMRDPDGHVLWFGESFDRPSPPPAPDRQLLQIMPSLPLRDVAAGIAHYRDVLGFTINYAQDNLGVMDRDDVRVLLVARNPEHAGVGSCYVYVRDADALHAELLGKGARVQGAPVSQPWGLRDFCVLDLEGNEIAFGQPFE
jgi:catechol 2,3-dioxygenase-like lactoylglutathione lyase family enzyme